MTHLLANYRPRIIDSQLEATVSAGGAVLIEGARACGKTATARRVVASEVNLETNTAARQAGLVDARTLLDGESPG